MSKVPDDGPAKFPTYDRHPVPDGFVPASGVLARARARVGREGRVADRRPRRADRRRHPQGVQALRRAMSLADFQPLDSGEVPRFAGLPTFMRLPMARAGRGRHRAGRRALRRRHHQPHRRAPRPARDPQPVEPGAPRASRHRHLALRSRCASAIAATRRSIRSTSMRALRSIARVLSPRSRRPARSPLTAGGDHLISLPILRALGQGRAARHDPFRRAFRHLRQLFRQPLQSRHAVPPRHRGGAARSEAHGADRHPRRDLRRDELRFRQAPTASASSSSRSLRSAAPRM